MSDLTARLTDALAGHYRLEHELGEGGMAIVYRAEDLRHHRKVAVKVLRPELSAAVGSERFLREIEIAAGLRHPHILPLYDSGEVDGLLYYVMPLVEGETLRTKIERERQLPIDDALRYAREVADALSYAHARGVVHRDIKPENILIESGHAVVADFGIAKAVSSAGQKTALTGTGMSIGTPAYMSPEQAAGGEEVDGRSDLYSLACVLYEMLAGQPPFIGATMESLVRQHITVSPPPVTQFRPAVPAVVSDALMRALAKAPADRFNPVGQFSAALEHTTERTVVTAALERRTRARWPVAALALGVLVVAGAAWAMYSRRGAVVADGATSRSIAVLPFANIGGDTSVVPLILGMHAEMVTQLTKLGGGLSVASRTSALEYRNSTKTDRQIAGELGVVSLLTGSVQRSGDQVRFSVALTDASKGKELWAESYDRKYTAENLFQVQGDIARQVANAMQVQLSERQQQQIARAPTTNLRALDLYYRASVLFTTRTPELDTITVRQLEEAVALDPGFVAAWGLLAQSRSWLLRSSVATDTMPALVALRRTETLAPGSLEAVLAKGYYRYYAHADFTGALPELEAADRLMPNSSEILYAIGLIQRRLGQWDASLASMTRAAQLDPRNPAIAVALGDSYDALGRVADAERELDRALVLTPTATVSILRKANLLENHLGDTARGRKFSEASASLVPPSLRGLFAGRVAVLARDYPRAITAYRTTEAGFRSSSLWRERSLSLALIAAASGDSASARLYADTLLQRAGIELEMRRRRGPSDPFGGQALVESQMAVALALRGERDAAMRMVEAALRYDPARDAMEGPRNVQLVAVAYAILGRRAEAVALLTRLMSGPSPIHSAEIRLDPSYDGLRSDPGFQKLVGGGK